MRIEVSELLWKHISVRNEVEVVLPVSVLHAHNVLAEFVLSRDLVRVREVVDLLILIQPLVEIALAT